jgi:hypothetical protein
MKKAKLPERRFAGSLTITSGCWPQDYFRFVDHPGIIAWHLESACRMRHSVYGLLPNQDGDLCKRLRFKWYGARKSFLNALCEMVHA